MKSALYPAVQQVLEQVNRVILGKSEEIRAIMTTFLANGHVLLEDIPGVGKATIAVAFSRAMGLDYKRVQFTPDVLPSDLTGFSVYRREEERFVYQPGSVSATSCWQMRSTAHPRNAVGASGSDGRAAGYGGRRDAGGTSPVSGDSDPESCRHCRNPVSSRRSGGPFYGSV